MHILVTYSSRSNTTAGIAEAIGQTLRNYGFETEVIPMKMVSDLTKYDGFVVGSAIQSAKWLPESAGFILKHKDILAQKPTALFSVCMTLAMPKGEKYRQQIKEWVRPISSLVHPITEEIFAGSLNLKKVPGFSQQLKFRISVWLGVWKEGDHRDWEKIKDWAIDVSRLFKLQL
jgi:menaquinone-dependent protoporphyrinogen oxidase